MSETLTAGLLAALRQSPDNVQLRLALLKLLLEHGPSNEIAAVVAPLRRTDVSDPADRRAVADALCRDGQAETALEFLDDDHEPETLIAKARALRDLGRHDEGRAAYEAAIAANAALEDEDLRRTLNTNVRTFTRKGQPKLTVIANDDTDAAEVVRLLAPQENTVTFADVGGRSARRRRPTPGARR